MGRGVIKAQVSSRTSCTAGRSAAVADETIAATHAKSKGMIRNTFLGICFLIRLTERTPFLKNFRFGSNRLICINETASSGFGAA
jgi:hypothetical protein